MNNSQDIADLTNYEIPKCTICLEELKSDLCSLNCGHIFHFKWLINFVYIIL